MNSKVRALALAALPLAIFVACGEGEQTQATRAPVAKEPTPTDPSCSSVSTSVKREEPPTGACTTGAECRFSTPGPELCQRPGAQVAPASGSGWHCACVDTQWACEVTSGGFGMIFCPDAGEPDAAVDAAGDAAGDAGTD